MSAVRDALSPGELVIKIARDTDVLLLALYGELDVTTAPQLERELQEAESDSPSRLAIDLKELDFMDSTGLHLLVRAQARSRENGHWLLLRRGPGAVQRVFELTNTDELFVFED